MGHTVAGDEPDLGGLPAAVVDPGADSLAFVDDTDGLSKKESIADLVSLQAGDGLLSSGGVFGFDASDVAGTGLEDDGSENLRTIGEMDTVKASATTTDATVTTVGVFTPTDDRGGIVQASVVGYNDDESETASYILALGFRRATGGVITQVGSTTVIHSAEDDGAWDATLDVDSGTVRARVTGAAGTTIRWQTRMRIVTDL